MKTLKENPYYLVIECVALFVLLPVILIYLPMHGVLFATLWSLALTTAVILWFGHGYRLKDIFPRGAVAAREKRRVLLLFFVSALVLAAGTYLYHPERFLAFVSERPHLWAMVMMGYPILSVLPQEVIYRIFFFERYAVLFKQDWMMVLMSGLAFGHAHIMFQNVVSYGLSVLGGWIFAYTYLRTRSFWAVWAEHALYGNFIFTVGLGWYFYTGAIGNH